MAQNKPSGFRFRLPWLLQPALAPPPATAPEPPRTTVQTSVASTSAPKPPFRPPGRAPPPAIATPRAPPQSVSSAVPVASPPSPPPPPPVEAKSPVPKSPIAKTIDPVATRSTKETQTTTGTTTIETTGPATPPKRPSSFRPPSPPQPSSPAKRDPQPSSPSRTGTKLRDSSPPVSPSRIPVPPRTDSKPLSPSRLATQPHVETNPSSSSGEATQSRPIPPPTSPVHVPTPPPPSPPSPPPPVTSTVTRRAVQEVSVNHGAQSPWSTSKPDDTPEIKSSTEITHEKFPVDSYHVPQVTDLETDAKPKEMTEVKRAEAKSMNPHSMEAKSPKPRHKIAAQVPLHREIRDDISKFIHKMATSPTKQSMDEKPGSVITLAGDNKGAFMHLGSDANKKGAIDIQRGYKLDATINGEGSSNGKKSERDSKTSEDQETKAIVNSNIQGINNSIMFNGSVTERNPGVHLAFSRTLANTDTNTENTETMEMYKAEVDISPPETVVYDPTLGRSHGEFFLEPSDSEPDDLGMFAGDYEIEVL